MLVELFVNISFDFLILGSFIVAIGQPFIINSPAKVATYWFKSSNVFFNNYIEGFCNCNFYSCKYNRMWIRVCITSSLCKIK